MDKLKIAATDLEAVLRLRMTFLEPPRSREEALSAGDSSPLCVHFGAYLDEQLVGVCSIGPEALPVLDHPPAWRLRGLVVPPTFRGSGIATTLFRHCLQHVETLANPYAWGYVKRKLLPLYSPLGFRPTGYTYVHPVGGETLLFGNPHTLRLIEEAKGIRYDGGELPFLGAVDRTEHAHALNR